MPCAHVGGAGDYPMTLDELQWAASLFEPPTADELHAVDTWTIHDNGLGDVRSTGTSGST